MSPRHAWRARAIAAFGPWLPLCLPLCLAAPGCAPAAGTCAVSADCATGALCFEGTCRQPCISDDACAPGYCDLGVCFDGIAPPLGPPERTEDAGPTPDAGDGGTEPGDGGPPPAPDAGPVDGGVDAGEPDAGPPISDDPCYPTDPYGADIDGDCLPDLVVGAPAIAAEPGEGIGNQATVSVLLGQADGSFVALGGFLEGSVTHGRFGAALVLDERKDANGKRGFLVGEPNLFGTGAVHRFTLGADDVLTADVVAAPAGVWGFGASVALAGASEATAPALGVGALEQDDASSDGHGLFSFATDPTSLRAGTGQSYTADDLMPDEDADGYTSDARIARVPDQDGDGRSDFAISGAGLIDDDDPVGVTLVSSATFQVLRTLPVPPGEGRSFGGDIAALPDYDGDGVGEIAISAPDNGAGRVYVAYSTRADYLTIAPPPQVTTLARFGAAIAIGGDFDDDGLDDLVIGAPFHIRVFPPPEDGEPDPNAPLAECASLRGGGYTGNCAGYVTLVPGSVLVARATGATATETALPCLHGGAGGRMGTALRALGPDPATGVMRLAVGSPGLSDRASYLGIFSGNTNGAGCVGDIYSFSVRDAEDVPVNGVFLGAAIAR